MDSATLTAAETQNGWKAWPERNELYFYTHLVKSVSFIYCHFFNKRHWDTKGEGCRPRVFWYIGHESSPWLIPSNGGAKGICLWLRDIFYVGLKGTTPSLLQGGLYVHPTWGHDSPKAYLSWGGKTLMWLLVPHMIIASSWKAHLGIFVWISLSVCKIMITLVTLIQQELLWQNKSHLTRCLAANEASTSIIYYGERMHVWETQRARARAQNSQAVLLHRGDPWIRDSGIPY